MSYFVTHRDFLSIEYMRYGRIIMKEKNVCKQPCKDEPKYYCIKYLYFLHPKFRIFFLHLWLIPHPQSFVTHGYMERVYTCTRIFMYVWMHVRISSLAAIPPHQKDKSSATILKGSLSNNNFRLCKQIENSIREHRQAITLAARFCLHAITCFAFFNFIGFNFGTRFYC